MKEGKILSGYILSIVAIVFAFINPLAGFVFGIISFSQTKNDKSEKAKKGKKMSLIAMGVSILFFIFSLLIFFKIINLPTLPTA